MLIETTNLTKQYGDHVACQNICLSLEEGQVFGLLGPNGAGKSTLVKMLLGLVHATSGQASIMGAPLGDREAISKMGYLPELFRQYEWLTGAEIMQFNARAYGIAAREQKQRISETLELVGLLGREKEKVNQYSKGMQQRLALAAAILHCPTLLFLDEPTSALDPIGRREVRDIITVLKNRGTTIFLNSHLLSEVEMTCTSLGFINKGQMLHNGPIETFMKETHEIRIEVGEMDHVEIPLWMEQKQLIADEANNLLFKVEEREDIPRIIQELVTAGARVYGVESKRRGIEEVFMELMEG
ncbi:MAG: ABC transporter ATP-binding protein [Bacillota bacterium]|nr:ABC transporter ATP-binding protein [Bacillota bacterium]